MDSDNRTRSTHPIELRQHFHNYFEILLGLECTKLHQAIASLDANAERTPLLTEIDSRINFLRGAVYMGKLLCIIDQDEAKVSSTMLSDERNRLRAFALGTSFKLRPEVDGASRLDAIRKSIQPIS